jgi:hypothetical protein
VEKYSAAELEECRSGRAVRMTLGQDDKFPKQRIWPWRWEVAAGWKRWKFGSGYAYNEMAGRCAAG